MHTVLGLSLNSDDVGWVLLDAAAGTVLDHDVLEVHADADMAVAAARSAHAIARACGLEVDRVRLTWTDDVARDGLRLRTRLRQLGYGDVETVPMTCATAVEVDPQTTGITTRLALAYGAALAVAGPSEPITASVVGRARASSPLPRRRFVSAALGVAAAAVLGLLCLSAGAAPQPEPPATTAQESVSTDAGWATVPAPSDTATTSERKVVAAPSYSEQPATVPAQRVVPVRAVAANAAEPDSAPAGRPHLSGALPVLGPAPELADSMSDAMSDATSDAMSDATSDAMSEPAPGPDMAEPGAGPAMAEPDMTEIVNALSALP